MIRLEALLTAVRNTPGVAALALAGCLAVGPSSIAAGSDPPQIAGFVDGSSFLRLAGDDAGTVEVSLQGALLKAVARMDPELSELVAGLESVHAVIIEMGDAAREERIRKLVETTQHALAGKGWERLARVREAESEVQVLVLNDEEVIRGLVVLVLDLNERKLVFANVAGVLDLAAIEQMGQKLDLPGLDALGRGE